MPEFLLYFSGCLNFKSFLIGNFSKLRSKQQNVLSLALTPDSSLKALFLTPPKISGVREKLLPENEKFGILTVIIIIKDLYKRCHHEETENGW